MRLSLVLKIALDLRENFNYKRNIYTTNELTIKRSLLAEASNDA